MLSWRNVVHGSVVYAGGDAIAAAIEGEFQISRTLGMMLVGGTLYAIEIPAYFAWIDRQFDHAGRWHAIKRMLCAEAFFNPLWIARHIALINLVSGRGSEINWGLLAIGLDSFLYAMPFALLANYVIQNLIPLNWRFLASALFSSVMAVYYASSKELYG
ncbi:hypothetical protein [Methylomicrobium sp. Wu6]|uniref:hypothetical protein n=1 Tax=Methylomicrobium sp. Wu6 TaxID=3107928 RepID=UPI002DD6AC65|nr:hypothetical protein [Methylomicrobium sp. Wu6]MEC4749277.1 hypothetical protein [Methylomicrobium sp. Wu6]